MSPADMTWTDIITAVVALYGAVLSTVIGVLACRARRPNIKVEVSEGAVGLPMGGWSKHMIFVNAVNAGHKAITLAMVGVILPDGERITIPMPSPYVTFPYELVPEKQCKVATPAAKLAANLKAKRFPEKVSLVGYYDDEVGRRHKGKPFIFDTSKARLAD